MIVAGLVLGLQPVREILIEPNSVVVTQIGDIALLFLMFFAQGILLH